jgi:UDP-glucuronate 4-epimerase
MGHYLVTGVAGFIASKVAEFLLADGHIVTGVDNLNDAYDVRLKQWRLAQLDGQPRFHFHRLDIAHRDQLDLLKGHQDPPFDAVINLAARAGVRPSVENPWIYFETNVTGALNLLELCRELGVGKFVLASTSSLYGAHNPTPFREDASTDGPLSPYAASKKAAEALCYTYHHLHGLDVTVLRYFTVYGPAGRPDMACFRFVQWIHEGRPLTVYGDGRQSRDFTYVDDIARGTIAALRPLGYQVINLGSDQPIVLEDAIRLVERLAGQQAHLQFQPRHPADMLATWADIAKAGQLLDWRPRVGFEDGMRRLVDWYRDNRDWARDIATGSS